MSLKSEERVESKMKGGGKVQRKEETMISKEKEKEDRPEERVKI